jgi:hypothetical protein
MTLKVLSMFLSTFRSSPPSPSTEKSDVGAAQPKKMPEKAPPPAVNPWKKHTPEPENTDRQVPVAAPDMPEESNKDAEPVPQADDGMIMDLHLCLKLWLPPFHFCRVEGN